MKIEKSNKILRIRNHSQNLNFKNLFKKISRTFFLNIQIMFYAKNNFFSEIYINIEKFLELQTKDILKHDFEFDYKIAMFQNSLELTIKLITGEICSKKKDLHA